MDIAINKDLALTTDSAQSSHGMAVLRHVGCDCDDYGPGDLIPECCQEIRTNPLFRSPDTMGELVMLSDRLHDDPQDPALVEAIGKWCV